MEISTNKIYEKMMAGEYLLMIYGGSKESTLFCKKDPTENDKFVMVTKNNVIEGIYEINVTFQLFCIFPRYTAFSSSLSEHVSLIVTYLGFDVKKNIKDHNLLQTIGFKIFVYASSLACKGYNSTLCKVTHTKTGTLLPTAYQEYSKLLF